MNEQDNQEEILKNYVEQEETHQTGIDTKIKSNPNAKMPWQKSDDQVSLQNQIGWQKLKIQDLPTQGLFYPEGAEVAIRAAVGAEIRHWSSLNEEDLSNLDDMLNYILERCCTFKVPGKVTSYKDLKEVDRFYVILAIREYTFIKGENKLQVKVSENDKIDVRKEMIDYIKFDERLMKYYDPDKRCFAFRFKSGKEMIVDIPSIGVVSWLKNYINRKRQAQQPIDSDFVNFAPFLIREWRGINDAAYEGYVMNSNGWSIEEVSLITEIRQTFIDTINPVIRYSDDGGMEHTAPLNFHGGIKSIFLIHDVFSQLG